MNSAQSQTERRRAKAAPLPPLSRLARESAATKDTVDTARRELGDTVRLFHTPAREGTARLDWDEVWSEVEAETPGAIVFQSNPLSD